MNNEIAFISDIHLSSYNKNSFNNIIDFLNKHAYDYKEIFFVGDTFDFYFPYKNYIPKIFIEFFQTIKQYSDKTEFYIIPGNHDLFLDTIVNNYGFITMKSGSIINRFNKKIFLMHGDEIFLYKLKNRIANKILHNNVNQKLFSLLPPKMGYSMGNLVSFLYKPSKTNTELIDIAIEIIEKKYNLSQYDYVIMGHIHKQYCEHEKIYVIGDFKKRKTYLIMNEKGVKCEYF